MQELRFVGPGDDGNVIVETTDTGEQFTLTVDAALRAFLVPAPSDTSGTPEPAEPTTGKDDMIDLRPRDIQTRVRAGEDPQAIADEAGTSLERVMRFAYPVLQERVRVVDEARRARTRAGADGHPMVFGELFDHRVAALGTEPSSVRWDSFRRPDGGWTVTSQITAHGWDDTEVPLLATFSLALLNRTVSALNDVAADLIHGTPIRVLQRPPEPEPEPVEEPVAAPADGPPTLAAVPAPAEADAHPSAPPTRTPDHRSPLRLPTRRQKAHTHPVPVAMDDDLMDDLFDQEAFEPGGPSGWHEPPLPLDLPAAADPPAAPAATIGAAQPGIGQPAGAPEHRPDGQPEDRSDNHSDNELEKHPEKHAESQPEHPKRSRSGDKPRMPSWDDILLGVRRKD
jgi:hypothetical protein